MWWRSPPVASSTSPCSVADHSASRPCGRCADGPATAASSSPMGRQPCRRARQHWPAPACPSSTAASATPRPGCAAASIAPRTGVLMRRSAHVVALWPGGAGRHPTALRRRSRPVHRRSRTHATPRSSAPTARRASASPPASTLGLDRPHDRRGAARLADAPRSDSAWPLAAVAACRALVLVVVGDGPLLARRAAAPPRRRPSLQLLGAQADVRPVLHAADLVLSTSTTEGMPGVPDRGRAVRRPRRRHRRRRRRRRGR